MRQSTHHTIAALALLFPIAAIPARAEEPPAPTPSPFSQDQLNELARDARADADAPALGLALMPREGVPMIAADGLRLANATDRVTPDDLWHLGSITKSMTATLTARLVEKGLVKWTDTVGDRLGGAVPGMHEQYAGATLAQLFAHRSGMPANLPAKDAMSFPRKPADPIADRLEWCRLALAMEPEGPPEETYIYSNNGYIVAGAMLEAATGRDWEQLMRDEVFQPLALTSAGFGPPKGDTPAAQPRGHRPGPAGDTPVPPPADNPRALGPAGTVHMSLTDLARYLHTHATRDPAFLSPQSYEKLHTPERGNYALGWVAIAPTNRWHNGSNTMWYAEAIFDTETGAAAAVIVNDGEIPAVQPTVRATLSTLMKGTE